MELRVAAVPATLVCVAGLAGAETIAVAGLGEAETARAAAALETGVTAV
jgi:hypothetical protein